MSVDLGDITACGARVGAAQDELIPVLRIARQAADDAGHSVAFVVTSATLEHLPAAKLRDMLALAALRLATTAKPA